MAEKRMFSRSVVASDAFLDMPKDAQCLYFQLNMAADDRGFCDCPRKIMRMMGASDDSMKILIAKKFVLLPESNDQVVVIKHWRINNNMRTQRFKETKYTDILEELYYDENKSYSQNPGDGHVPCLAWADEDLLPSGRPMVNQRSTNGLPSTDQRSTQNRIEQNRVEESSTEENKNNNPIYLSGEKKSDLQAETIKYWHDRLEMFKRQGFETDGVYGMAAAYGVTKEDLDNYKEEES